MNDRDVLPPRSCVLVTGDFVRTGGMDQANFALASYLARVGWDVHVVAHRVDPELLNHGRVTFHRVPKLLGSYMLSAPLLARGGSLWAKRLSGNGTRVIVNGGSAQWDDVNWVHYVHAAWPVLARGSWAQRAKARWLHARRLRAESTALQQARVVITNSTRTSRDVIERLRVAPQRVRCVPLGVDPVRFRPGDDQERKQTRRALAWPIDRPQAVFVGALADLRKGLDLLLSAWRELCADSAWDVDLNVIGHGRDLGRWRQAARDLGQRVRFVGFRHDMPDLLRAADVLVAPSRYESYGLSAHEAFCCGTPALVNADAGMAERYPSELSELLIRDVENREHLVNRLRHWRGNLGTYRIAAQALGAELRRFTWDDMSAAFLAAIDLPRRRRHQRNLIWYHGSEARRVLTIASDPTPQLTIRPRSGWAAIDLRELWQFRHLLFALAGRDVKLRYRQTLLGVTWVIFQPLLAAGIMTLVFGVIAKLPSENVPYFVFAYAGQLAWNAFSNTFSKAGASMVASSHLVSKVYFPRLILPLSTVASTLIDFAVATAVMVALMLVDHVAPTPALLLLPLWLAVILALAIGLGLMAAALMVSYRDVQYILPVLLPLLMYASPVAYSLNEALLRLPSSLRPVLALNPLSSLLEGFRWSLLGTQPPALWQIVYSIAVAMVICSAGAVVFKRMERRFADVI